MKNLIKVTLAALLAPVCLAAPAHADEPTLPIFADGHTYPSGRSLVGVGLLSFDARCELGRTVKLQTRPDPSAAWSTVGTDVTTYSSTAAMNVGPLGSDVRILVPKKKLSDGTKCAAYADTARNGRLPSSSKFVTTRKAFPGRTAAIVTPKHELLLADGVLVNYYLAGGFSDVPAACRVGREVFLDVSFNGGASWLMFGRDRSAAGGAWGMTIPPNLGTAARFRSPAVTISGTACPAIVTPLSL